MDLHLITATRKVDSILRFMIIEDGSQTIYAKAREDAGHIGEPEEIIATDGVTSLGQTTPFANDEIIVSKIYTDLTVSQSVKYTLVMWLDGWDAQQTNDMLGGLLKLSLNFSIVG